MRIGGIAAGLSAASQIMRQAVDAQVVGFEKGDDVSSSAGGMPYNLPSASVRPAQAIKRSIQTGKYARDFYLLDAKHMKNQLARRTFKLLAAEEVEHAKTFYDIYQGDDLPDFADYLKFESAPDSD